MTTLSALTAVLLTSIAVAPSAHAGPGGGGGHATIASVSGAGQRLSASFGGKVKRKANGKLKGKFYLSLHPSSPTGSTLNVACIYRQFSSLTVDGSTATFQGKGKCRRLLTDGKIETVNVENIFQVVDNPDGTDAIDINFVGSTGVAVAGGSLSFGNFTVTG